MSDESFRKLAARTALGALVWSVAMVLASVALEYCGVRRFWLQLPASAFIASLVTHSLRIPEFDTGFTPRDAGFGVWLLGEVFVWMLFGVVMWLVGA